MLSNIAPSPPIAGKLTKTRLPILDGLRGVAAMIVVAYHIFDSDPVNSVNHGYLGVDFFFMLSGYVMGYAYDDRWNTMSIGSFFRRRLVRLHPMVVIGSIIGAIFFYFSASSVCPLVEKTSFGTLLYFTVLGALLIPALKSMDVRGFNEAYPLNGPAWSLLFEYVANIAYAFWIRKFSVRTLGILSAVLAGLLTYVIVAKAIIPGTVACGWVFDGDHLPRAMVRMLFPFVTGLFLFRLGKSIKMKHAMMITSLALLITLPMPKVGPVGMPWVNGLYECVVIIILMPMVVLIGAGSQPMTGFGEKVCNFLGELSYPLYLVHYPVHCVFFGWLSENKPSWGVKLLVGLGVYIFSVALGYVVMRFVDAPIRKRLARFAR